MISRFRHVALIGKYQASGARMQAGPMTEVMEEIAAFLTAQGCEVVLEASTADSSGATSRPVMSVDEIGRSCDLALVVGGDGTMLGFARQLARPDGPGSALAITPVEFAMARALHEPGER